MDKARRDLSLNVNLVGADKDKSDFVKALDDAHERICNGKAEWYTFDEVFGKSGKPAPKKV